MKAYSNDFRTKIVETHLKEKTSIYKTAQRFNVSYSFVWKLLKRYEQTGEVQPRPHGGGQCPKLTKEQVEQVASLVEANKDATLEELADQLHEKIGIRVSRATMGRIVQQLQLTRKKKSLHATEALSERVQKLRGEYWTTIGQVKLTDLIFIDESGVNLAMTRRYALCQKRATGLR
jgi:transposase